MSPDDRAAREAPLDFRALFEATPGINLVLAPDPPRFTMLAASDERLAATHATRAATIGRPLFESVADVGGGSADARGVASLRASLETVVRTRRPHRMHAQQYDVVRADGAREVRWWTALNVPVLAPDGELRWILHHVDDVTDSPAAELHATLESIGDGVYIGSAAGITLANQAALDQLGYASREELNRNIGTLAAEIRTRDAETGAPIAVERQAFARALAGERVVQDVVVRHRATGDDRVVRCAASPVVVDGRVIAAVAVNTDVTDLRRLSDDRARLVAELQASQERLRLALDAAAMAVWDFDAETNASMRSPHHDRLFGHDAPLDVWNFDTYLAHVHPDDRVGVAERLARALAGDAAWKAESRVVWPDGSVHWIATQGNVVRDGEGEPRRVVGIVTDVTERRAEQAERERLYEEAREARAEAEAANRAKSEFLAVMSHELRTPLNAIAGYTELLELGIHGPVTEAQRTALARIQASQRHLLTLISDVLNYSRAEVGAITYHLTDVRISEAVAHAEVLVAPQLRAKGLGYGWAGVDPELCVRADREKLQQILLNLLSNAVKFTQSRDGAPGRIDVSCDVEETPEGDRVHVRVRDTGDGIGPDQLQRIFEPFVQVDQRLTRPQEGVGLGLAISRDLARAMGGDVTVASELGVGSTFTVTLPRA